MDPRQTAPDVPTLLSELEDRLDRLRALYEQYFLGFERMEPMVPRKDVERRFQALRRVTMRNTAVRFKFNTLTQRYQTYQTHWMRVCRQIEEGTYKRHVQKAAARFGAGPQDEKLSAEYKLRRDLAAKSVDLAFDALDSLEMEGLVASSGGALSFGELDDPLAGLTPSAPPPAAAFGEDDDPFRFLDPTAGRVVRGEAGRRAQAATAPKPAGAPPPRAPMPPAPARPVPPPPGVRLAPPQVAPAGGPARPALRRPGDPAPAARPLAPSSPGLAAPPPRAPAPSSPGLAAPPPRAPAPSSPGLAPPPPRAPAPSSPGLAAAPPPVRAPLPSHTERTARPAAPQARPLPAIRPKAPSVSDDPRSTFTRTRAPNDGGNQGSSSG